MGNLTAVPDLISLNLDMNNVVKALLFEILERTFRAVVERVGDVAGQTHMQRAAKPLVMWLCS